MLSPVAHEKKHFTNVNTPDFAAEFMELESETIPIKSSSYSRKGNPLLLTSAPTSLFNSPQEMQYTQGLEQTIVQKYSAVKEVFNNLSGEETESSEASVPRKERTMESASDTWKERPAERPGRSESVREIITSSGKWWDAPRDALYRS